MSIVPNWQGRARRRPRTTRTRAAAFGSRLKALREDAALTHEDVARHAGIGEDFYRRLEAGEPAALTEMNVDRLWPITDVLGITPRQLFQGLD